MAAVPDVDRRFGGVHGGGTSTWTDGTIRGPHPDFGVDRVDRVGSRDEYRLVAETMMTRLLLSNRWAFTGLFVGGMLGPAVSRLLR